MQIAENRLEAYFRGYLEPARVEHSGRLAEGRVGQIAVHAIQVGMVQNVEKLKA